MTEIPYPARGYLDMLLYTLDSAPDLSDASAAMMADGLIDGRYFAGRVEEFADAIRVALRHGELPPDSVDLSRRYGAAEMLDFLARVGRRLDELRPWPEPAFVKLAAADWPGVERARPIARVPLPAYQIGGLVKEQFDEVAGPSGPLLVLVLRLRGGAVVALRGPVDPRAMSFDLVAREDGEAGPLVELVRDLVGFSAADLVPIPPPPPAGHESGAAPDAG
ncbi:hypothetical protein ACFFWC_00155 [Plantactinospora siamensis]|uniref:Uncharacterized protein n=1 Tax=Plantactinospora siamensis TaxID=555372 RepID=A0ABV6NU64_9ACTN